MSHGRLLLLADLNIDIKIDKVRFSPFWLLALTVLPHAMISGPQPGRLRSSQVEQSDSGVRVLWEREGEIFSFDLHRDLLRLLAFQNQFAQICQGF